MGYKSGRVYQPRLTKQVRDRLRRLLPMEYRPREVARELGVSPDTLYRGWIPAGAPHRREADDTIWIVGTDLAAWLQTLVRHSTVTLKEGEAFCLRCQQAVVMTGPLERVAAKYAWLIRGTCPQCGNRVARFESPNDPSPEL